jgi:putative ABC transport system permease protein
VTKYFAIREQNRSFEDIGAFNGGACGVRNLGANEPGIAAERIYGQCFTPSLFGLLGVKPIMGRTFTEDEDRIGKVDPVVLISHAMWERRFGSDSTIVGKKILLTRFRRRSSESFRRTSGSSATRMFRQLRALRKSTLLLPWSWGRPRLIADSAAIRSFARLKPSVSIEQAQSEIDAIASEIAVRDPDRHEGLGVRAEYLGGVVHRDYRGALLLLQGSVAFVLLISCANVAGLLLARNASRRREVGLRIALGPDVDESSGNSLQRVCRWRWSEERSASLWLPPLFRCSSRGRLRNWRCSIAVGWL